MADVARFVGRTPLIRLTGLSEQYNTAVWAKLESRNPGGSIKDRTAFALLQDALDQGLIRADTVVIEATSGNTGIALAMACATMGIRLVVFMPEGQSMERKQLFWAFGATIIETPQAERTSGAIRRARDLAAALDEGVMLRQHENPANPAIHERTTGPEIWEDTAGAVEMVVAGVGTGGTITGLGRYFKTQKPAVRIVAVEPANSAVISGDAPGPHKIQGIGAGFVPENFDRSVVDQVVTISDEAAWDAAQRLPREEGVLVGLSSGAVYAALERLLHAGARNIVAIFADSGERYLSTGLYQETNDRWLRERLPDFF